MDISFVQLDKEDVVLLVKGVISFLSLDTHDGLEKMMEIKKTLFMYGSDRVFKAMNEWLKYCNPQYDQKEMLNKVLKLLVLIRKDLQNNSKLKVDDILLNIMQSEEEVKKFKSLR